MNKKSGKHLHIQSEMGQGLVEYSLIVLVIVVIVACVVIGGVSLLWGHLSITGRIGIILGLCGISGLAIATLIFVPAYLKYLLQVVSGELSFSDFITVLSSSNQSKNKPSQSDNSTASADKPSQSNLVRIIEIGAAISGIISCLLAALTLLVDILK